MSDKERTARRVHFLTEDAIEKELLEEISKRKGFTSSGEYARRCLYKDIGNYEKGFFAELKRRRVEAVEDLP